MKKTVAVCLSLALLTSCFAGCSKETSGTNSGQSSEQVTLTIFHQYNEELEALLADGASFRAMINQYKENFPNVQVEEEGVTDNWTQKIITYSAAGDMPDVFQEVNGTTMDAVVKNGSALDLTEVLDDEYLGQYKEELLQYFDYDGKVYGLPYYVEYQTALMYNKKLWEEAGYSSFPETLDEIFKANDYFQSKGISTFTLGDQQQWILRDVYFVPLLTSYVGEDWVTKVGKTSDDVSFEDPKFVEALDTISKMGSLFNSDWKSVIDTEATTQYLEGKAAATLNGQWGFAQMESSAEDYPGMAENTGFALLPGPDGAIKYMTGGIGCGFSLSSELGEEKESAHYEAAVNMLKYLTGPDYNTKMAERGYISCIKNISFDDSKVLPIYQEFFKGVEQVTSVSQLDKQGWDGQLTTTLAALLQDVATENKTPENGAKEMQNVYEGLLS